MGGRVLLACLAVSSGVSCGAEPDTDARPPPPTGAVQISARVTEVDHYLSRASSFGFSGAVLVGVGDSILLNAGYGTADRATGTPVRSGSVFELASVSKLYTAATVLRLADAGRLDLDAPAVAYLDSSLTTDSGSTLRSLLTHSSGLPREVLPQDPSVEKRDFLAAAMPLLDGNATQEAGWTYSNAGYALLAEVIASATGLSFEAAVQRVVLDPLRLEHSAWRDQDRDREPGTLTRGYRGDELASEPENHPVRANARGAGGMLATTGDVFRFVRGWIGGELLSDSLREASLLPTVAIRSPVWQALGWRVHRDSTGVYYYHPGDHIPMGYSSEIFVYPADGLTVILLSNTAIWEGLGYRHAVGPAVRRILAGDRPPALPEVGTGSPGADNFRDVTGESLLLDGGGRIRLATDSAHRRLTAIEVLDQEAAARILGLADSTAARVAVLDSLAVEAFSAAVTGDFRPLGERLETPTSLEAYSSAFGPWFSELADDHGAIRVRSLATVPARWPATSSASNLVLEMDDGTREHVRVTWGGDRISSAGDGAPVELPLHPTGDGGDPGYVWYDLFRKRGAVVRPARGAQTGIRLTLLSPTDSSAVRALSTTNEGS